jgi:hypothetical protein
MAPYLGLFLLLALVAGPTSSSSSSPSPTRLDEVVFRQDQLIASLQTTVGRLQDENAALREQLRVLETASATVEGASRAPVSALRAEVLRLVARSAAAAGGARGGGTNETRLPADAHPNRWREPQHVTISCKEGADVLVRPLSADDVGPLGECLLLEVRAPPQLDARFALYCGPEERDSEDVFERFAEEDAEGGGGGAV